MDCWVTSDSGTAATTNSMLQHQLVSTPCIDVVPMFWVRQVALQARTTDITGAPITGVACGCPALRLRSVSGGSVCVPHVAHIAVDATIV